MKRISSLVQKLASAALKGAPLATVLACITLGSGSLVAEPTCSPGAPIYDVRTYPAAWVGCKFTTWGPVEKSRCTGGQIFGNNKCHICVPSGSPTAQQLAKDDYSNLSLDKNVWTPLPPTFLQCLNCTQPPAGLTAWWTLDEPAGQPHVYDFQNNMPNGYRYNGAASVPGQVGNATKFDGIGSYIEIPNAPPVDIGPGAADGSGDSPLTRG
jgi:hypothetical protein